MRDCQRRFRSHAEGPVLIHRQIVRSRQRIWIWIGGVLLLTGALIATILWPPRPILMWNASPSSPVGLYLVTSPDRLSVGDHVAAWAPDWARKLGAERHYIPLNVPLVKRVAAATGDHVCVRGGLVILNGVAAARRRRADAAGRLLPRWQGCGRLGRGEYFLFDAGEPDAFDGRYFGLTSRRQLVGRARLIWRA